MISIQNLIFYNVSIKLNNASITMHNCHSLHQSLLNTDHMHSNVSFTSKTFADSHIFTIYGYYGIITLSGDITFADNTAVGGGAMYLQFSRLYIASCSTVTFENNIALDHGAIYFEPGITLNRILSQDDPHKCFYYPWSKSSYCSTSDGSTYIDFTDNIRIRQSNLPLFHYL